MYSALDTLRNVPEIDVVVRGEGELTVLELLSAIEKKKGLSDVDGITYRTEGEIYENKEREHFEDLDSIPIFKDFDWEEYPEFLFGYLEEKSTSIISVRLRFK